MVRATRVVGALVCLVAYFTMPPSNAAFTATALNEPNQFGVSTSFCTDSSTYTVHPNADTWLRQDSATTNYGGDTTLEVRPDGPDKKRRALLAFPLPANPLNCVVTATLRLNITQAKSDHTIEVYRATSAWEEMTVTWNTQPSWTGTAVSAPSAVGWQQWEVTDHVRTMYEGSDHGFVVLDGFDAAGSPNGITKLRSREDASDKPELIVDFAPG